MFLHKVAGILAGAGSGVAEHMNFPVGAWGNLPISGFLLEVSLTLETFQVMTLLFRK